MQGKCTRWFNRHNVYIIRPARIGFIVAGWLCLTGMAGGIISIVVLVPIVAVGLIEYAILYML